MGRVSGFDFVVVLPDVPVSKREIVHSRVFQTWYNRLDPAMRVEQVTIHTAHKWNGGVQMIFMNVRSFDGEGREIMPGLVFLRGDTVDILTVLVCEDQLHYVFIEQPRVPVGMLDVISNPSGMSPDSDGRTQAMREVEEELGAPLDWQLPVNLGQRLLGSALPMLVSPGGSDERVTFYYVWAPATRDQLQELHGSTAGVEAEGERTVVHVINAEEVYAWLAQHGPVDAKTLLSLLLFHQLR